jgi:hypothetical protein
LNWDAIGAIGEAVGAAAVVASLLYVASQIRADSRARRIEATHVQIEAFSAYLRMLASNNDVAELFLLGIRDFHSLSGAQVVRFSSLLGHLYRIFEDIFYQRAEDNIDARVWRGFEGPMGDIIAYPGVQDWWKTRCHWYSQEFQQFIAAKVESARPPSLYGESDA